MARAARAGWLKFSSSKLGTTGDSNHRKQPAAGHGGGPQVGAGRQLLGAGRNDTSGGLDPRHSGRNLGRGGRMPADFLRACFAQVWLLGWRRLAAGRKTGGLGFKKSLVAQGLLVAQGSLVQRGIS